MKVKKNEFIQYCLICLAVVSVIIGLTYNGIIQINFVQLEIDPYQQEQEEQPQPQSNYIDPYQQEQKQQQQQPKSNYLHASDCSCNRSSDISVPVEDYFVNLLEVRNITFGQNVGLSNCNNSTTELGGGQRVFSYALYTTGSDPVNPRYTTLLSSLADSITTLFPGWRMRIYHNLREVGTDLCSIYCTKNIVDLCDVRYLPTGNLIEHQKNGMFWRFQPLGDPTVAVFVSRDLDSYLEEREKAAMDAWLNSTFQFHIMRDGPFHKLSIHGGLWGAKNYLNIDKSLELHKKIRSQPKKVHYNYDQEVLGKVLWPAIRNISMIHDSYHCLDKNLGNSFPWPTKRQDFRYVGYGPSKDYASEWLSKEECPIECRPNWGKDWSFC